MDPNIDRSGSSLPAVRQHRGRLRIGGAGQHEHDQERNRSRPARRRSTPAGTTRPRHVPRRPAQLHFKTSTATALNPASRSCSTRSTDASSDNQNCIDSFGSTSYADALQKADGRARQGRPPGRAEGDRVHDGRRGQRGLVPDRSPGTPSQHGLEPDLANPATASTCRRQARPRPSTRATPSRARRRSTPPRRSRPRAPRSTRSATRCSTRQAATPYCAHGVWGQIDGSNATSQNDYDSPAPDRQPTGAEQEELGSTLHVERYRSPVTPA